MDPYVSVTKYKGKPVVEVRIGENRLRYPLTADGCRAAGRDIYKGFNGQVESWMNSSSVDFPQEVKKGCRLDVRELMAEGFRAALDEQMKPQRELVAMILAHCEKDDFQKTLTPKQQALFKVIAEKTRKGE